jgi:hypothetical protein
VPVLGVCGFDHREALAHCPFDQIPNETGIIHHQRLQRCHESRPAAKTRHSDGPRQPQVKELSPKATNNGI